jgi:hypothetical protein
MKRVLCFAALTALLAGSAYGGPIFYSVDPTGTYLRVDPDSTGYTSPLFIDLSALGLSPGTAIALQTLGDFSYQSGGPEVSLALGASFVNLAAVNPDKSLLYRLSNILELVGNPIGAGNVTYPHGLATDIEWDFEVPTAAPTIVTIPTGATYLAVGVVDSWYDDNTDPNGNLRISIEQVPEPGTLMFLAPGLGLLWAIRRRKAS